MYNIFKCEDKNIQSTNANQSKRQTIKYENWQHLAKKAIKNNLKIWRM